MEQGAGSREQGAGSREQGKLNNKNTDSIKLISTIE